MKNIASHFRSLRMRLNRSMVIKSITWLNIKAIPVTFTRIHSIDTFEIDIYIALTQLLLTNLPLFYLTSIKRVHTKLQKCKKRVMHHK